MNTRTKRIIKQTHLKKVSHTLNNIELKYTNIYI